MRFRNPITAEYIGDVIAATVDAAYISAGLIAAGEIVSTNYDGPDGSEVYADAGTRLDLVTGALTSVGIAWDGAGNLQVKGDITGSSFVLLKPGAATDKAEWFAGTLGYNYNAGFRFYLDPPTTPHSGEDAWFVLAGERTPTGTSVTITHELRASSQWGGPGDDVVGSAGVYQTVDVEHGRGQLSLQVDSTKYGGGWPTVSSSLTLDSGSEDDGTGRTVSINTGTLTLNASAYSVSFASNFVDAIGLGMLSMTTGSRLRVTSASGWVDIGPSNSSWCHFNTDRAAFYFGSTISPVEIEVYNNGSAGAPVYSFRTAPTTGIYTDSSGRLWCAVGGNDRLTLGVSWDTTYRRLHISESNSGTGAGGSLLQLGDASTQANIYFDTNGNDKQIRTVGTDTLFYFRTGNDSGWATVRGIISDASSIKYKRDVTPARFGLLDKALAVEPVTFRYRKDRGRGGDEGTGRMLGVIAEQAHPVAPEVTLHNTAGEPDAVSGVALATLAIGAVHELHRRVVELEQALTAGP